MLHLRQLTVPLIRLSRPCRFYAKGKSLKMSNSYTHQEVMKFINPFARIHIRSDIFVKVRAADVHEYPNGDAFVAELHGGEDKNSTASLKVDVSDDEEEVNVEVRKLKDDCDYQCVLAVPIKASIRIDCANRVQVAKVYGELMEVNAKSHIHTDTVQADKIALTSDEGHIQCQNILLGKDIRIQTAGGGPITLDKLQGDKLHCKSNRGKISVRSCYVDESRFETETGDMDLKNVHKSAEVDILKKGDLKMTGVHGCFQINSNGGKLNLQLSEVSGGCSIKGKAIDEAIINISDSIEENSYIEVESPRITLESALSHLSDCITPDGHCFRMSQARDNENQLLVQIDGTAGVKLGKLSWSESMRVSVAAEAASGKSNKV